jgi:acetolactate synthase small subunit
VLSEKARRDETNGGYISRPHYRRDLKKATPMRLLTGDNQKMMLEAIDRSAILETVRTGSSGIGRGERILKSDF